jgi:hypothetical protein
MQAFSCFRQIWFRGQRETVDALIIHELCHLVDQSEYTRDGMICPVPSDDAMVVTLHRAFDQWEGPSSIHSVEFCCRLVAAAASAVNWCECAGLTFSPERVIVFLNFACKAGHDHQKALCGKGAKFS